MTQVDTAARGGAFLVEHTGSRDVLTEHFEAGDVPKGTGTELAGILFQDLQARGTALIPFQQSVALLNQADPALVDAYEPALAVDLGKCAGATKAIMGVMIRYEERSGSWFGSRDPAAVAFSLALPFWWQEGLNWWTRREVAERAIAEATDALVGKAGTATPSLDTSRPINSSRRNS